MIVRNEQRAGWTAIKVLVMVQVVTLVLALSAGVLAVRAQNADLSNARHEVLRLAHLRVQGRLEQCHLIRGLGFAAAPKHVAAVERYFAKTPLSDCERYAHGK